MRIKKIIVHHKDIQRLADIVTKDLDREYVRATDDMIIVGAETYRMASNTAQWVMVVLNKQAEKVEIDLMDADHGTALLSFRWKESKFIDRAFRELKHHCEMNGWELKLSPE